MKATITTLFLAVSLVASAQVATYKLEQDFGLRWDTHVSDLSAKYTVTDAKAKFGKWYARYIAEGQVDPVTYPGRTDANFMKQSEFSAAFNEAIWRNHGAGHINTGNNTLILCQSRSNIEVGAGRYMVDLPATLGHGNYTGHGSSSFYTNGGSSTTGSIAQGGTELVLDVAGWLGNPNEMFIFRSSTWGRDELQSYQEAFSLNKFRLVGGSGQAAFSGPQLQAGVAAWDMGSVSSINYIFAENFGTAGFYFVRGTPGTINTITSFRNGMAGVLIEGGGMFNFQGTCEFDENPAMFHTRAGHGRPGWCSVSATAVKGETGRAPGRDTPMFQALLVSEEGGDYNFTKVDYAAVNSFPHSLVYINPKVNASFVKVGMLHLFGPCYNLLHDAKAGKMWLTNGQLNGNGYWFTRTKDFVYESGGGGNLYTSTVTVTPIAAGSIRMGGLLMDPQTGGPVGAWDNVAGTPAYKYLGGTVPPPPPPPTPVPCTYTTGPWGECINGVQVRTVTSSPAGCTGTPPNTTQPCTIVVEPPPVTPGAINPADVLVVINSADPASAAMAQAYSAAWKTTATVTVNLGSGDDLTNATTLNNARTAINALAKQYTVLAFSKPSRYNSSQSITSAITYGARSVAGLTASPLYNYTGTKPRTDKGVAPSFLLVDAKYIRANVTKNGAVGNSYMILAKDQSGTPRGSARAGQTATGLNVWDYRNVSGVGEGNNGCNQLSMTCWITGRIPSLPILAYYGSMNSLGTAAGVTWRPGFYGDHVTSFGGWLPGNATTSTNSKGQTALTWHLDRGASMSVGSVSEPWQGSNGSLAQQFVNVSIFHPQFLAGTPVGVAAWSAVQSPDRMLFAGDPLYQTK